MNLTNIMGAAGSTFTPQPGPTNQWSTEPFACDANVPRNHLLYAFLCCPCAAAHAKAKADKTNPVFNFLCFSPLGSYNSVRRSYGIIGECKNDMLYGCLCGPCGARQAWTESNLLGPLSGTHGADQAQWFDGLFSCDPNACIRATFCPCWVAHDIRQLLLGKTTDASRASEEKWFHYCCLLPMSMYGQTRHDLGIRSEWPHPTCEDVCVGCFFYPCALVRANVEALRWRTKQSTNSIVTGAVDAAKRKSAEAAANAKNAVSNMSSRFGGGAK